MANKRLAKKRAKQEAANKMVKEAEVKTEVPVVEETVVAEPEVEVATTPVEEIVVEKAAVEEVKAEVEAEVETEVEVAPAKKPAAKRTRKTAVKVSVVVQAAGKELTEAEVYERVTEDWCKAGNDKAALKTMDVYVKPEESAIYYVINGDATGRVDF